MNKNRLDKILHAMAERDISQLVITDPATIYYLAKQSIHPGERLLALVLSLGENPIMVANKLFQLSEKTFQLVEYDDTDDSIAVLKNYLQSGKTIGIDKNWPSHFLLRLMNFLPEKVFVNGSEVIDKVRGIKDKEEIVKMRAVSQDNDRAIGKLRELLTDTITEVNLAKKLGPIYDTLGNSGFSFEPIVAFGKNTSDPHHMTDTSTVKPGDSVVFDIGGVKDSYCSDMTRTFFYQEVSEESREVYETVKEANQRAIEMVKPGVRFCEIDATARDYITEKGYGQYFTHRTGHFIGLECHEPGDVSRTNRDKVEAGMIFSIEPGIYIPGKVGVRIEDLVVATEDGCEVLNKYSKDLTIIS